MFPFTRRNRVASDCVRLRRRFLFSFFPPYETRTLMSDPKPDGLLG